MTRGWALFSCSGTACRASRPSSGLERFRWKCLHFLARSSCGDFQQISRLEKMRRERDRASARASRPGVARTLCSKSRRDGTQRSPQRKLWGCRERQRQAPEGRHTDLAPCAAPPGLGRLTPRIPTASAVGYVGYRPSGTFPNERRRFDLCWRMQRKASFEELTHGLWPCRRSTRFHSKTHRENEPGSVST